MEQNPDYPKIKNYINNLGELNTISPITTPSSLALNMNESAVSTQRFINNYFLIRSKQLIEVFTDVDDGPIVNNPKIM